MFNMIPLGLLLDFIFVCVCVSNLKPNYQNYQFVSVSGVHNV